mmetsp:Transcript_82502/g.123812  ORF Transcript_82502/g.123812 Transcript_82502/m.123812 type:complete len:489 (+) Transcript_82502:145-1611(+)
MAWQVLLWRLIALRGSASSHTMLSPELMGPIVNHPAVAALELDIRPRRKLKERHMKLFPELQDDNDEDGHDIVDKNDFYYTQMLNKLGLMACRTGVVPRKELLETFAAATYIDAKFPQIRRVADVAAGHGLLSWFLLALDPTRSAICIDRRMPPSADIIANSMLELYPNLESKWCYVEADLASIESHPSTLIASVHACGGLSDKLIEMAIDGKAPIAVVPCCHSVKEKKGYQPHPLTKMKAEEVESLVERILLEDQDASLGDIVDQVRCTTLETAGYDVEEAKLPELFTKRNRLILGQMGSTSTRELLPKEPHFNKRPAVISPGKQMPSITLPLADDKMSRAACKAASGRRQASARLVATIPRHFSPTYDVSVWLPDNETLSPARLHALQVLGNDCCDYVQGEFEKMDPSTTTTIDDDPVRCTVSILREPHFDTVTGNVSQTYQMRYANKASLGETGGTPQPLSKKLTKAIQKELQRRLPLELGLTVR